VSACSVVQPVVKAAYSIYIRLDWFSLISLSVAIACQAMEIVRYLRRVTAIIITKPIFHPLHDIDLGQSVGQSVGRSVGGSVGGSVGLGSVSTMA